MMSNTEYSYYLKYIKYKNKYLNLIKNNQIEHKYIQTGGGSLQFVSWNVLNHNIGINLMTFKNYSQEINTKLGQKVSRNFIVNLAKLENIEYKLYRKQKILNIISKFNTADKIICLQEVSSDLLNSIKLLYTNIAYTNNSKSSVEDYRVTILPDNFTLLETKIIDTSLLHPKSKSVLGTIVLDKNTNKKFIIFNIHIYWKFNKDNYIKLASQIKTLVNKLKLPFVIGGDFNADSDSDFILEFVNELNIDGKIGTISVAVAKAKPKPNKLDLDLDNFTSVDTKSQELKYGWIDNFIIGGFKIVKPTSTTNLIDDYYIFYNVSELLKLLFKTNIENLTKSKFKIKSNQLDIFNQNKFISDHKPIFIDLIYN